MMILKDAGDVMIESVFLRILEALLGEWMLDAPLIDSTRTSSVQSNLFHGGLMVRREDLPTNLFVNWLAIAVI